jgi:hypothetical protein
LVAELEAFRDELSVLLDDLDRSDYERVRQYLAACREARLELLEGRGRPASGDET